MTAAAVIECMLLRWSDNQNGRTVTLLLEDDGGDHPFKGLKCGPANGERLAISVARIADDETQTPVQPRPSPDNTPVEAGGVNKNSWHEMLPAQQAGMLCKNEAFIAFLYETLPHKYGPFHISEDAARFVREHCQVGSRADLDTDPVAAARWKQLVSDYRAWMREPEVVPA